MLGASSLATRRAYRELSSALKGLALEADASKIQQLADYFRNEHPAMWNSVNELQCAYAAKYLGCSQDTARVTLILSNLFRQYRCEATIEEAVLRVQALIREATVRAVSSEEAAKERSAARSDNIKRKRQEIVKTDERRTRQSKSGER